MECRNYLYLSDVFCYLCYIKGDQSRLWIQQIALASWRANVDVRLKNRHPSLDAGRETMDAEA